MKRVGSELQPQARMNLLLSKTSTPSRAPLALLTLAVALCLMGCTAEDSARIGLTIATICLVPLLAVQCVIAGPTLFGQTIGSATTRTAAIAVYLLLTMLTIGILVASTGELMGLRRATRINVADQYLIVLGGVTVGVAMLGSLLASAPPPAELEAFEKPRRLPVAWALLTVAASAGLCFYVFW